MIMIYIIDHKDSFTYNLVHLLSNFDKVYVSNYNKIIPCGVKDKTVTTLKKINNQDYDKLPDQIIKNLIICL